MRLRTGLLVTAMLVSGCVSGGGTMNSCAGWKPIYLSGPTIDALTDGEAQAILAHNEFGAARKCW
jgi:Zn-dependent protease with chaperone function